MPLATTWATGLTGDGGAGLRFALDLPVDDDLLDGDGALAGHALGDDLLLVGPQSESSVVSVVPKAISPVEVVSRSSTRLTTMLMPLATAVSAPGLIRSLSPIATPLVLEQVTDRGRGGGEGLGLATDGQGDVLGSGHREGEALTAQGLRARGRDDRPSARRPRSLSAASTVVAVVQYSLTTPSTVTTSLRA